MSALSTNNKEKKDHFSISRELGCHGPYSPVTGKKSHELLHLFEEIKKEPALAQFEKALYYQENSVSTNFLIPFSQKEEADRISKNIFTRYIADYITQNAEINENTIIDWHTPPSCSPAECVLRQESWRNRLGWHLHAKARRIDDVAAYQDKSGCYLPPYVCAYHEIQHVEDVPPFCKPDLWDRTGKELKETLKTKILCDEIYKEINKKGVDSEVDYGHGKLLLLNEREICLGKALNFYRKLEERYLSLHEAILSPQSIEFLKKGGT